MTQNVWGTVLAAIAAWAIVAIGFFGGARPIFLIIFAASAGWSSALIYVLWLLSAPISEEVGK